MNTTALLALVALGFLFMSKKSATPGKPGTGTGTGGSAGSGNKGAGSGTDQTGAIVKGAEDAVGAIVKAIGGASGSSKNGSTGGANHDPGTGSDSSDDPNPLDTTPDDYTGGGDLSGDVSTDGPVDPGMPDGSLEGDF